MKPEYRIFFAHSKAMQPGEIDESCQFLAERIQAQMPEYTVAVTSGRDDYFAHFGRCGGWDPWERDVGRGVRFFDAAPRYHAFVCPDNVVSRATAHTLQHALEEGKPVLFWAPDQAPAVVRAVRWTGEDEWKSAWILELSPG